VWRREGLVGEACASLSLAGALLENFPIHIYRENDGWIDRGARRPLLGLMVLGHGRLDLALPLGAIM